MSRRIISICWLFLVLGLLTVWLHRPLLAQEEKVDLDLRLVSAKYYNEVIPGKDNIFFLEVWNTGNKTLTNIRLYSEKPGGWFAEFKPSTIDYLGPGAFQTVDINIKPDSSAGKGEYSITVIAQSNEIRRVKSIWLRVEQSTTWLWIGAALTAIIIAGFVMIFIKFGRP